MDITTIEIIDENDFFIVLNKPTGVSCHNEQPSLVDFLKKRNLAQHFVTRLDVETSGLVLIAKKSEQHDPLLKALAMGQKIYRALGRGQFKKNEIDFEIKWALSDKAEGRRNPQGRKEDQKNCLTKIKAIRSNSFFTEFYCEIKTGRQHQIRKHLCLLDHPIIGDKRYNDPKYNKKIELIYKESRLQLHAEKISFEFENKNYSFEKKYNFDGFFKIEP